MATYGNEVISVKNRSMVLFTPFEALYKTCLCGQDVPKEDQITATITAMAAVAAAADEHYDCILPVKYLTTCV